MYKMLTLVMMLVVLVTQVGGCSIEEAIAQITARVAEKGELKEIKSLRSEMLEMKREVAWYSLHVAAAAACRGSTPTGGSGPHFNVVLPKENTVSCTDQCGQTEYRICDADVAIQGGFGKATTYTEKVGQFYNYRCDVPGNMDPRFDEVKADQDGVFTLEPNVLIRAGGARYYRFCCCRYA